MMCAKLKFVVRLLVISYLVTEIASRWEYTNVKCESLDKKFSDFEYCFLKSVNRTYKYLSIKVKLFQNPVTKVKINFGMYKRFNGYRPFLYNFTIDACRFFENQNSNPIAKYIFESFKPYSNMNHSCPYSDEVVLDKLNIQFRNHRMTSVLPFPEGDYLFYYNWYAYDINRAVLKVYFTLS